VNEPSQLILFIVTVVAYLLGGLPFGYWFVKLRLGKDIRTMGSGNIGATNVHRTAGSKAGVVVLLLDIFKGFLAVFLASLFTKGSTTALALAAAAVVLGHCYPIFLKFKGGKAVACFIGAFGYIAPLVLLVTTIIFVVAVALTRFISLGSILGALVFPALFWMMQHPPPALLYSSIFAGLMIVYRHRGNIQRLLSGSENVFSLRRKSV
jgi:acyl phosphate:glycerol-3-phosphate acyltransferase